jgi:cytochrome P450
VTTLDTPVKFPFALSGPVYEVAPELRALVEHQPVARAVLPDGSIAWLVSGLDQARQVYTDPRFSRALATVVERERPWLGMKDTSGTMVGLDPPDHNRLRRLVAGAFTRRRVQELRPRVARIVGELLDGVLAGPRPADLVRSFSLPLPVRVICEMLGVPRQDQDQFRAWSDGLIGSSEREPDELIAAFTAMAGYFAGLIEVKRARPADDLMTALIAGRDGSDRLSEDELVMLCITLLIAGHETTAAHMGCSLLTVLARPAELDKLRRDPLLIPAAVEEMLRFVQLRGRGSLPLARVTTEDVQLGGVTIPAGELVLPLGGAAGRDPSVFPDPNRLDLSRVPSTHLAVGAGVHPCVGAQLARVELQEAFRGLLSRVPGVRLAVPPGEVRFREKVVINSPDELPVTWDET